ncbi:MAG: DNA gyrase subunit A [Paludibacteraceae bacterium]|jgi:DNA gyrase subunit A|nr:DNA gyrase subunit A [Paludibacteraceae bacterium]
MIDNDRIIPVKIDEEMRSSYIDYSMSVIVSRALPDVRDGFKPVHRRVLYAMNELGNTSDKPTKKSARIVGEVMGKYHPHGDSSIYGTLVRLAQPWAMRNVLVDGQGNFGSVDGDGAAAMRYTEARLSKLAEEMLRDIEKDTVDMQNNFDDSLREPTVLPTRFPNLLVNGASGIAVGMATNMPTHNLGEVVDGCLAYIRNIKDRVENPEVESITIDELMEYIKAPDFPTGGTIYGYQGVRDAFETGRGRIVIRSNADIETEDNGRERIIITELPYGVVKADLVKNIAELVSDKKIEGISDISDQSKRDIRVVIEVKRDANAQVVLNKLYKFTALQSSFAVNNIALVKGRPMLLNLKQLLRNFIDHRMDVVTRRARYDLKRAEEKAHILAGMIIAVNNIDEVVEIIKTSRTPQEAQSRLEEAFNIDNLQSKAIVEMRLAQLTGLQVEKLKADYEAYMREIDYLRSLLASEVMRYDVIYAELEEIKEKYSDERRTRIVKMATEFNPEDMYADDDMVITISHLGYIKRTPLADFRSQARGGIGSKASASRDQDFIEYVHQASMHSTMMFFTEMGRLYWLKVYEIPEGNKQSKGRAIQNIINLQKGDKVRAFINVKGLNDAEYVQNHYLIFATKNGLMKKTTLEAYSRPRANGIIALSLREGDELIGVRLTDGESEMLIASYNGKVVRFPENTIRPMGRSASGVRAIKLDEDSQDRAVGMICVEKGSDKTVLVISDKGFGKRTALDDENGEPIYRITNRGGKGVKTMNLTDKTGPLIGIDAVTDADDLMLITKSGTAIRMAIDTIRVMGRATQGVKLIELQKRNDTLMFGCIVPKEESEEVAQPVEAEAEPQETESVEN